MEPTQTTLQCESTCTVAITVQWPAMTSDQVADYMQLWAAFLAAGVFVLVAKALYNRFRVDHHGT
jgi:hypothetical protein